MDIFGYYKEHQSHQKDLNPINETFIDKLWSQAEIKIKKEIWRITLLHTKNINEKYYHIVPKHIEMTDEIKTMKHIITETLTNETAKTISVSTKHGRISICPITNNPYFALPDLDISHIVGFYIPHVVEEFGFGVHTLDELAWTLVHFDTIEKAVENKRNQLIESVDNLSEGLIVEGAEYMELEKADIDSTIEAMRANDKPYGVDMLTTYKTFSKLAEEYYDHTHQFLVVWQGEITTIAW